MTPSVSKSFLAFQLEPAAGFLEPLRRASLMHGWIPVTVQLLTAAALLYAIGWRSRRWRTGWLPVAVVVGVVSGFAAHCYFGTLGIASEPPPWQMWLRVSLSGSAAAVTVVGWPSAGWWRRNVSVFAASFCLLSMGLTINGWLGYFPTVATAVNQLTGGPLPDQTDMATVRAMQSRGAQPVTGALVPVDIDSAASGFRHRPEWVYLPPAWFTAKPASRLPTLMMIGAEFNTPADWVRAGDAVHTLDVFAAGHNGEAPVAVFVDPTGAFNNDTECVNGPRGNAADHLTKDVVPYTVATFGLSGDRSRWGVVGFTSGGTCAVDLAVMHSDMLSAFVDIAGDLGPNAGTKAQTVDRLYGGDAEAWSAFDPTTVITRHGPYADLSGVFAVPAAVGARSAGNAYDARSRGQADAAETQRALGRSKAISCSVQSYPGGHTWPFAATAFRAALPWLADRLGRPDSHPEPLPCHNARPTPSTTGLKSATAVPCVVPAANWTVEAEGGLSPECMLNRMPRPKSRRSLCPTDSDCQAGRTPDIAGS